MNDPYHKETLENTMTFMNNCAAYPDFYDTGFMNDIEYYKVKIPFDQVKVPVHMIHGTADPDIFYTQAEQAHAGIPDRLHPRHSRKRWSYSPNLPYVPYTPMYKEAFAFRSVDCFRQEALWDGRPAVWMAYDEEILNKKLWKNAQWSFKKMKD